MSKTTIELLADFGQSAWLDNISRAMIDKGVLKGLIEKGLRGQTSNPTIFEKSIIGGLEYDEAIRQARNAGKSTFEIYDDLTVRDIQDAADLFRQAYETTRGHDGYVSLEINPQLAYQTKETIEEGIRLFHKVNRPNLMLKVPATEQGFGAISRLLGDGINVNVTLIFSVEQYVKTAQAYLAGMELLLGKGGDPRKVHSVASVFVSRLDNVVDGLLDERLKAETNESGKQRLNSLKGKAGVSNSHLIYSRFREIFTGPEFRELQQKGANIQRVLWGSTGTKNPAYSDIKYVTELIARDTVNTMPDKTLDAFLDHGAVKEALGADSSQAQKVIDDLAKLAVDTNAICQKLLTDGAMAFTQSFDSLLLAIEQKAAVGAGNT